MMEISKSIILRANSRATLSICEHSRIVPKVLINAQPLHVSGPGDLRL